jgi:hypothetical protein
MHAVVFDDSARARDLNPHLAKWESMPTNIRVVEDDGIKQNRYFAVLFLLG